MSEPVKIERLITRREYDWLKTFKVLEPHEEEKIRQFEEKNNPVFKPIKSIKKTKKVNLEDKIKITKGLIWHHFKEFYKIETGKEFVGSKDSDSIKNIEPIIKYFALDDDFVNSERLLKDYNRPSLKKGLLIIGMFGNGKTTIMKTLSKMFDHYNLPMKFKSVNAHDLVTEWESIETPGDKSLFFERYLCRFLYIDDVKKERKASNYGVTEIIQEILQKRYDKKLKTFITCNYRELDSEENIEDAINEFNRYGNHIVDRVYEMFNIIQFKGKSFR